MFLTTPIMPSIPVVVIGHRHMGEQREVAFVDGRSGTDVRSLRTESEALMFAEASGCEVVYGETYDP